MTVYIPTVSYTLAPSVIPVILPDPIPCPDGWIVGQEHNGRIARIRHDLTPRSPGFITNEIEVLRPELKADEGAGVDTRSKITFKLGNSPAWDAEFDRLNGVWIADRLQTAQVGWFDTGWPVFSMLDCGGNLVEILPGPQKFKGWVAINYQHFQYSPIGYDWHKYPYLVTKQVLVAGTTTTRILVDKGLKGGYGDAYIPKVADEQPYCSLWRTEKQNGLELVPDLPLHTTLHGAPVTVERYCFWGANTYGEISGNWYCLEEMLVTGTLSDPSKGGNMDDRRVYVDPVDWLQTCPPPVIGWQRKG